MLYLESEQTRVLGQEFLHSNDVEVYIPDTEFLERGEPQVLLHFNDLEEGDYFPEWALKRCCYYVVDKSELEMLKRHAKEYRQKQFSTPEKTQDTLHFYVFWLSVDASNHCMINTMDHTGERLFSVRVKNEDLDTFIQMLEDGIRAFKEIKEEKLKQLQRGTSAPNTTK